MKALGLVAAAVFIAAALPAKSAAAAARTWCLCQGKESGRLHHRFACEVHFKKPGRWPATGAAPATGGCSRQEWAQFKTYLCVGSGCTYEYIGASESKIPVGAP